MIELIKDIIIDLNHNYRLSYLDYINVLNLIIITVSNVYPTIKDNFVKYVFDQLIDNNLNLVDNEPCLPRDNVPLTIPESHQKIADKIKYIANLPQPEQRSKEWFDLRKNMLTASTCAQALNESHYGKFDKVVLDKIGFGERFTGNKYTHHGVKYEPIATMLYEHGYDARVDEYGLIRHIGNINFLGASPDGIVSKYSLMKRDFCPLVGTMIEIKCPYSRKILTSGPIDDGGKKGKGVCPHNYYCQVQQQLECCDLNKCDFWQCSISEYDTKQDWIQDNSYVPITEEQNIKLEYNSLIVRGAIIKLKPKYDPSEYNDLDAKYLYPPHLLFTKEQYQRWILEQLEEFPRSELAEECCISKVIYWKLNMAHNVTIPRDKEWFQSKLPQLKLVWDKVMELRNSRSKALQFKKKHVKSKHNDVFLDSDDD